MPITHLTFNLRSFSEGGPLHPLNLFNLFTHRSWFRLFYYFCYSDIKEQAQGQQPAIPWNFYSTECYKLSMFPNAIRIKF